MSQPNTSLINSFCILTQKWFAVNAAQDPASNTKFGISVHSHPRAVAGYLARRVFQGWRATSGRALRMISRLFVNGTVKIELLSPG
jgi:hypothetical protein